jgi:hypothetical protein
MENQLLLTLDSRRRISLGALAKYDRYFATVEAGGIIVLTPAIVLTVEEAEKLGIPVDV